MTSCWIVRYLSYLFGWHGNIMAPDHPRMILGAYRDKMHESKVSLELSCYSSVKTRIRPVESYQILLRSRQDHGKIVSPCNTVVVCIYYCLICSLVAMHDHGTGVLTELVMHESCAHCELQNCQKLVHVHSWSHPHPLCMSVHRT